MKGSEVETLSQYEHFVLLAASFIPTFHSNGQNTHYREFLKEYTVLDPEGQT